MSYATTERIAMNHAAEEIEALKALVADLRSALVETTADAEMCRALLAGQGREITALREKLMREKMPACGRQAGDQSGELNMTRRRVIAANPSSHKSALAPWRTRRVWSLLLECGHREWRYRSRFPTPPKWVVCHTCREHLAD